MRGEVETRDTDPLGVNALVVGEPARPSRVFAELVAALDVPVSVARNLLDDAMAKIGTSATSLAEADLGRLGPDILWIVDRTLLVYGHQRAVVRSRVEKLLHAAVTTTT